MTFLSMRFLLVPSQACSVRDGFPHFPLLHQELAVELFVKNESHVGLF